MIRILDLYHSYGKNSVLNGLELEWENNKIHGIIGANGSGKSTLFKIMKGLLNIQKGKILHNSSALLKSDIAFLPTDPVFYPRMKGNEYLDFFRIRNNQFDIQSWNEIMQLPLNDLVDNYSTGMKKKLALLACLGLDRSILLLDEPFNGLDSDAYQITLEILIHQKELGKTIILSSHISQSLTTVCDDIAHLDKGRINKSFDQSEFSTLEETLFEKKREHIRRRLRGKA